MVKKVEVLMCVMLAMSGIVSADYLANGSFDQGTATSTYVIGDNSVTDWTKSGSYGTNLAMYHVNRNGSVPRNPAAEPDTGAYYVSVAASYLGENVFLSIEQDLGTLEIGNTYTIAGLVNNDNESVNCDWQIKIGDTVVGTGTQDQTWQTFSFDYVANVTDGTNPTLYLGYIDSSPDGTRSSALYDAVTIVPEPMTVSLLLVGGALAALKRRKNK